MVARAYRPSGKSESGALLRLLMVTVAVALVVGIGEGVVGHLGLNLLLVFPALIGFAVGSVANAQIRKGKIRAPGSAALFACLAALLGQGATHGAGYFMWRQTAVDEIAAERQRFLADDALSPEERAEITAIDPEQQLDSFIEEETGERGFLGYLHFSAGAGVTIGRIGSGSDDESAPTLTGAGTWVLWGVEFLIAGLVGFVMAYSRARKPFCEICKDWYSRVDALAVGSGNKKHLKEISRAIESGDFSKALEFEVLGAPDPGVASLLTLDRCATCEEHEPLLTLKLVKQNRNKTQTAEKYKTLIRADEARVLLKIVEQRAAEAEAVAEAEDRAQTTDD